MTCCNVIIPNNKISLCILPMAECLEGPWTTWYFGYILTIWAFLSKQLTGHWQFTQNYKIMIQWRKIISYDFHHIPKLSIGFNGSLTHLQALQISMKFLLQVAFDIRRTLYEIFRTQTFWFRYKKPNCNPDFLLFSLFAKSIFQMLLENWRIFFFECCIMTMNSAVS